MATPLNKQQQLIVSYPTPNTSTPMATNTVVKHKKINNEKISQLTKRVVHLEDTLRETVSNIIAVSTSDLLRKGLNILNQYYRLLCLVI